MTPKAELAIEFARVSISDEGIFSPDQIKLLDNMIQILATAIEAQAVMPFIHDVSHKVK